MLKRLVIAITALFALTTPAAASFGDCTDDAYLSGFGTSGAASDPFHPARQITCIVEFEIDYIAPGGPKRIRGIRDAASDWAFYPGAMAAAEEGARGAVRAMKLLGDFAVNDITFLILEDTYERMDSGHAGFQVAAETNVRPDECMITMYMLSRGGQERYQAYVAAHEIFHCIENATLTAGQFSTVTGDGAWWAEGAADYFAALAVPEDGDIANRARRFEAAVEAGTPVYDMSYGAAVFFFWFHGERGPSQLIPFLQRMASANDDAAQRSAMRAAMSDDEWIRFVEAYADRSITAPAGQALEFSDGVGDARKFTESRTERFTLEPFVVNRGLFVYDCGAWENELRPDGVNLAAREDPGRDWGDLPAEIDTEEEPEARYRYAAINTGDGPQRVELEVDRTRSCEPCAGSEEIDMCVVGTWRMTGGGPVEWMRAQGVPITAADPGERVIRFDERGVYFAQGFAGSMTMDLGDDGAEADGQAFPALGRWSIADDRLAVCQDSGGMEGTVHMEGGDIPVAQPGAGTVIYDYNCSRTSLDTTQDMGTLPPMRTSYTRESLPPEDE